MEDSMLVKGVIVDKDFSHPQMPKVSWQQQNIKIKNWYKRIVQKWRTNNHNSRLLLGVERRKNGHFDLPIWAT